MNHANSKIIHDSPVVRRKPDFLPTVFVSPEFDAVFLPRLAGAFADIIRTHDAKGDRAWKSLMDTFEKHGLFQLSVPKEIFLPRMEFRLPDGKGGFETRVYERKEPLAFGFEHVRLDLDRKRIGEPSYLSDESAIRAYLFAWRLFGKPLEGKDVVLSRLDARALDKYLVSHHRGEVSADSLSKFLIARVIDPDVEHLPAFALFDRLGERISAMITRRYEALMPVLEETAARRAAEALAELDEMRRDASSK